MSISPVEAASSLAAIHTARHESRTRYAYRKSAPFMIGWGIVWAIGYTGSALLSADRANDLWLAAIVAMIGFSALVMRRQSGGKRPWTTIALFTILPAVALIALVNGIIAAFKLHSGTEILALFLFVVAAAYAVVGMKYGHRYTRLGVGLAALTALGLAILPPGMQIAVFFVDAAVLILAGLWLRRA